MIRNGLLIVLATALSMMASGVTLAQSDDYWTVTSDQAACIVANAKAYAQRPEAVVVIVVQSCPESDPVKAIAMLSTNSAVPGIGVGESATGKGSFIFYSHEELDCLGQLSFVRDAADVKLPKKPKC